MYGKQSGIDGGAFNFKWESCRMMRLCLTGCTSAPDRSKQKGIDQRIYPLKEIFLDGKWEDQYALTVFPCIKLIKALFTTLFPPGVG